MKVAKLVDNAPEFERSAWNLPAIVRELRENRERWRHIHDPLAGWSTREFPSREVLADVVAKLCGALYPLRLGPADLHRESEDFYVGHLLDLALRTLVEQAKRELSCRSAAVDLDTAKIDAQAVSLIASFAAQLPAIRALLDADVDAAYRGDPAAQSRDEVVLSYPGMTAVIYHRLAHTLHRLDLPLIARIVAELAHSKTGIDIHPGARIGRAFFIDHGTGVVIGETAVIGDRVRLYQAVTLGAKRFTADANGDLEKGQPRHPIIEDDVVIYAGATILGRVTIGRGSIIGGNVWLTQSVSSGSVVTQAQAHSHAGPDADNP